MAINIASKKEIVADIHALASTALAAIIADHQGVNVEKMTLLRKEARRNGVDIRVVRNTLLKRAVVGTDFACAADAFTGPTMIAFSQNEPGAAARLLKNFAQANETFKVRACVISRTMLPGDQIGRLADLPTQDQAVAILMGTMLAPIEKLARTLNDIPGKTVRVIAAVRDLKQAA